MHAYTIHRNRDFWGEDAEEFRPERWFEGEPERTKEMDAGLFHFGYGFRVCIGKDIATMELYKLLPEVSRSDCPLYPFGELSSDDEWMLQGFVTNLPFSSCAGLILSW
jgi:cytochrome P450